MLSAIGGGYVMLVKVIDQFVVDAVGGCFVDVGGGCWLYICFVGMGGLIVVFELGFGELVWEMVWLIVFDVVLMMTVVVYDRVGYGCSDVELVMGADVVCDLYVLFERVYVLGFYVLVGYSFGGMFVLSYAHCYLVEVGGIVFLDSMHFY